MKIQRFFFVFGLITFAPISTQDGIVLTKFRFNPVSFKT